MLQGYREWMAKLAEVYPLQPTGIFVCTELDFALAFEQ